MSRSLKTWAQGRLQREIAATDPLLRRMYNLPPLPYIEPTPPDQTMEPLRLLMEGDSEAATEALKRRAEDTIDDRTT